MPVFFNLNSAVKKSAVRGKVPLEELKNKLKEGKGDFVQRYYTGPLKDPAALNWKEHVVELEGNFHRNSLFIVVVEIDQS